MARWGRRPPLIIGFGLLGLLLGVCSVVPPRHGVAVVTVSRFGSHVGLLSSGVSLSFLPLAARLVVPLHDNRPVIETTLDATTTGGATTRIPVQIEVAGSGRLPIGANDVRERGW